MPKAPSKDQWRGPKSDGNFARNGHLVAKAHRPMAMTPRHRNKKALVIRKKAALTKAGKIDNRQPCASANKAPKCSKRSPTRQMIKPNIMTAIWSTAPAEAGNLACKSASLNPCKTSTANGGGKLGPKISAISTTDKL